MGASNGKTAVVELLLERGGRELMGLLDAAGMSCLHFAAACADDAAATKMAEMIVAAGGRKLLEQADSRLGWTPLHNAVDAGHSLLVGKMLEWMGQSGDVEQVKRSVEALQAADFGMFRGVPQMAPVDSRERVVRFFGFSTVRSRKSCHALKCYYEVTILRVDESPQIGFAVAGFARGGGHYNGVGDGDQCEGMPHELSGL